MGRDTHARAIALAEALRRRGWRVWLDVDALSGNLDAGIAQGIDASDVVLVCLTRAYCRKVQQAAIAATSVDNCFKEFHYALSRGKPVLPLIFDASLRRTGDWSPGVVPMHLSALVYVDCTGNIGAAARAVSVQLRRRGVPPVPPRISRYPPPQRAPPASHPVSSRARRRAHAWAAREQLVQVNGAQHLAPEIVVALRKCGGAVGGGAHRTARRQGERHQVVQGYERHAPFFEIPP